MIRNGFCFAIFVLLLGTFVSVEANAQVQIPGVKTIPILKKALSVDDTKEAVISSAEVPAGAILPRHTHPGDDFTVVLQGKLELYVEGLEPRQVSAGEAFHVPNGIPHYTRVLGDTPVRILAMWVIEKGKPPMQPAPK